MGPIEAREDLICIVLDFWWDESEPPRAQVAFSNLSYTISVKRGRRCSLYRETEEIKLLQNVSGVVPSGSCVAILGASGAGKTTFLNAVAQRLNIGRLTGEILYGGTPYRAEYKHIIGYVEQTSSLMPNMTVYEFLMYTADLIHAGSKHVGKQELRGIVNTVIKHLGLESCTNTTIGSPLKRGISGGQAKRCDIAVQLLKEPALLALDEPTSGLDYSLAKDVVCLMRELARREQSTVMCTIHQPSADMFAQFDQVVVLDQGRLGFMGSPAEMKHLFDMIGKPMGEGEDNLAQHALSTAVELRELGEEQSLPTFYERSEKYQANMESLQMTLEQKTDMAPENIGNMIPKARKLNLLWCLLRHRVPATLKEQSFLAPRVHIRVIFALLLATMWTNLERDADGAFSRTTLIFFLTVFVSVNSVVFIPTLIEDRTVFGRERADGLYPAVFYVVLKLLNEMIALALSTLGIAVVLYWSANLNPGADNFFYFVIQLYIFTNVAVAWTFLMSTIVDNPELVTALTASSHIFFVLLSGFLIVPDSIPVWWEWAHVISYVTYGFQGLLVNEFRGRTFDLCGSEFDTDGSVDGQPCGNVDGEFQLKRFDIAHRERWNAFGLLFPFWLVFFIFDTISLYCKSFYKR